MPKIIFIAIISFAVFLRIYQLDKNPPSLFADEVDVGYQAYSFLKTFRDYNGNLLPLSFQSFADFRTPLYIYSVVPMIKLLGLSEWAVRLPAAFFGIMSVLGIYFLIIKLGFNKWIGLIGSMLLTISPWHLQYSRAAFEVTLMMALIIWGTYFFLTGLKRKNFLFLSAIFFALTFYSYSTAKLFIPLSILGLFLIYKDNILRLSKKWRIWIAAVFLIISLPFLTDILRGQGAYRFSYTNIFADPTISKEIDVNRFIDSQAKRGTVGVETSLLSKFSHNKVLSYFDAFFKNYFSSFSTQFLFLQGDYIGRHSIGRMGQFYMVEILTMLLGFWWLWQKSQDKTRKVLMVWLLISPIPAALTVEGGGHASRLFLLLTPLVIISSSGFYYLLEILWRKNMFKKAILFALMLFFTFNIYIYFHRYYIHYPKEQERLWHYGFKQAIQKIKSLGSFNQIVFTPTTEPPLIFWLFWTGFDPASFQKEKLTKTNLPGFGSDVPHLGNFYIASVDPKISLENLSEAISPKMLVVANRKDISLDLREEKIEGIKLVDVIEYPSGEVAFYLLTHE